MSTLGEVLPTLNDHQNRALYSLFDNILDASQCIERDMQLSADIHAANSVGAVLPDIRLINGEAHVAYPPFSEESEDTPLDVALTRLCDDVLDHMLRTTREGAVGAQLTRTRLIELGAAAVRVAYIVQDRISEAAHG